jgi:hypothetical protein
MEEQNVLIVRFWRNPKQCDNMHVYRHYFGRMLLKQASISIIGTQYVVIIGILPSNSGTAPNQTYLISRPLVLQTHINFPRFLPIFPDFLERLSHLAPI